MLQRHAIAIPAVDLLDGRVVRLHRGDYRRVSAFDVDPVQAAARFRRQGAEWLHVIDLSAARSGVRPAAHARLLAALCRESGLRLQVGGGVRTRADVEWLLELGVARVLVGTLAVREPGAVGELATSSGRLAVACDVRGGSVRVAGWLEDTGVPAERFLERLVAAGVADALVTAIDRDGTGAGPDTGLIGRLRELVPGVLLAAGGIGCAADVAAAAAAGADAVVIGRALYDGSLTLPEASASLRSSPSDSPS